MNKINNINEPISTNLLKMKIMNEEQKYLVEVLKNAINAVYQE
jgi:hypothetical protein